MKYDVIVNNVIVNTIIWDGVTPIYAHGYKYFDAQMNLIITNDFQILQEGTHNYQRLESPSEIEDTGNPVEEIL